VAQRIVDSPDLHSQLFEPKRLTTAMLFSDIVGFSRFSEHLDPHLIADITNDFLVAFQKATFKHAGIYDKAVGDCGIAIFGVPIFDDAEHAPIPANFAWDALQAAMEIQRRVAQISDRYKGAIGGEIAVSTGIAVGPVLVGLFGPDQSRDFTAIGKFMNLAARLQGEAPSGGILISEEMHEILQGNDAPSEVSTVEFSDGHSFELKNIGMKKGFLAQPT